MQQLPVYHFCSCSSCMAMLFYLQTTSSQNGLINTFTCTAYPYNLKCPSVKGVGVGDVLKFLFYGTLQWSSTSNNYFPILRQHLFGHIPKKE